MTVRAARAESAPARLAAGAVTLAAWLMCTLATPATAKPLFKAPSLVYEAGVGPTGLAVADLDRDGRPDMVTVNGGYFDIHSTVSILHGMGDAAFETRTDIVTGRNATSIAVADFDGDGAHDLAVAHGGYDPDYLGTVSVMLGRGDGTFAVGMDVLIGCYSWTVAAADLNADGHSDLMTGNCGVVTVLLGNGDGTFRARTEFASAWSPRALVTADLNEDGRLDLTVVNGGADEESNMVAVMLGNGDGTLEPGTYFGLGYYPSSVTIEDFDRDGHLDLAVPNQGDPDPYVAVLRGRGDGTFGAQLNYRVGYTPASIASADLSSDGRVDLAVANCGGDPDFPANSISVLLGNGDGTFAPMTELPVGAGPRSIAIVDLDQDGNLDLATGNAANSVSAVLGNGDGTFGTAPAPAGSGPQATTIADFNRDGRLDLAVATRSPYPESLGAVSVLSGDGNGAFSAGVAQPLGRLPRFVAADDLNADGAPDLVALSAGNAVLLGNGDGTFGPGIPLDCGESANSVAIADLNGDGRLDLAVSSPGAYPEWNGAVSVLLGNGDGTFSSRVEFSSGVESHRVTIADFNGDGRPDLAIGGYYGVSIMLGKGDGTFGAGALFGATYERWFAIGDLNGDGRLDLALTRGGAQVSMLFGNGDGTFGGRVEMNSGGDARSLVIADFNGDDRMDLAVVNNTDVGTVSVWLGSGAGAFGPRIVFGAGRSTNEISGGDLNLDGRTDLVALGSGTVSLLLSNGDAPVPVPPVDMPVRTRLSLEGFRPNPAVGPPSVQLTLGDDSHATLDVIDVAGRRLLRRELRNLTAGPHRIVLEELSGLPAGVYLVRLQQAGRTLHARGVAIR